MHAWAWACLVFPAVIPGHAARGAGGGREAPWLPVGNVVRPWLGKDAAARVAVLDVGVCFSSSGWVQSVSAYVVGEAEGLAALPTFFAVSPAGRASWRVAGVAGILRARGRRFLEITFEKRLAVAAGDCLAWTYPSDAVGIGFADLPTHGGAPSGADAGSISARAVAPEAVADGDLLSFSSVQHRRHALQAQFLPAAGDFLATALQQLRGGGVDEVGVEEAKAACWAGDGSWPTVSRCCVPAGVGQRHCFDERYTYEACCASEVVGPVASFRPANVRSPFLASLRADYVDAAGAPRAVEELSVDLVVRTFHAKLEELIQLLRSVAFFWPPAWGVVVVLDGGSDADAAACRLLPAWARCRLQERPFFHEDLNLSFGWLGGGFERHRGLVWKEWSECWADEWSDADFIAVTDSDVVFVTFGVPQLLFERGPAGEARPIIWAHTNEVQFPEAVLSLGLDWQSEFMDSFPLVVRRKHFREFREYLQSLFPVEPDSRGGRSFDRSFEAYVRRVHQRSSEARGTGECPSFHSMMGSYLWQFHRNAYGWSIRHGHLTGVPAHLTCPRLRVAQHVAYWGADNWMAALNYPFRHLKVGGRPAWLSEAGYAARASALILAGLCAVPWAVPDAKAGQAAAGARATAAARRDLAVGVNGSWGFPDSGLRDINRDLCTYAAALVEGSATPEQRLLSHKFPGHLWTAEEAEHCGGRQPHRLFEEYQKLMAALVFVP